MSHPRHHAIVVTSWDEELIGRAHAYALECCRHVTPIVGSAVNRYSSFLIAPDGSKEGWADSELGDARRAAFVRWADAQRYEDGSSSLEWCEVAYGSDDSTARITRHAWGKRKQENACPSG
jgi:hypothetical protein